jgi:predicted N-acetyltransferase YhbS
LIYFSLEPEHLSSGIKTYALNGESLSISPEKISRGITFSKMKIDYLAEHKEFIPVLAKWHQEQWSYLNPSRSLADRTKELEQSASKNQVPLTFVAISGGVLLGSASLVEHDMDTRMDLSPWLASVYVAAPHREQGVGSALVKSAVDEAQNLNIKTLYLFTPDQQQFYARFGWTTLEYTEYRGEKETIMSIQLRS